uniref:probable disease resistance protein At4g27220 n=1 Tax=Erigeron canadensis TaxID=72917 RepID=UPI001CB92247|nr:probable disease resistance protein At4g27220 [Erigeron canadensis]
MAEIGTAVAEKVVDSLFVVAKKEIGYLWNYKEYVENLRRDAKNLEVTRGEVQELVYIAISKGDKLKYGVEDWVKEADTELSKANEFLEKEANAKKTCCKIGLCGNWKTLHRYGKTATQIAPPLLLLQERGSAYKSGVSVETRAPGPLDVYQNKDLSGLHTHDSALGDIIKSLEDETIQITGIYGLGGVGKTTLAMEVATIVKNNKLFADVAFTTVSQNIDVGKIQKDIGEATKRIMRRDKILIILDDVWETLDLQELCIPFGNNHKNCKILLTSRNESVCDSMNVQRKICVNALPTAEAWILFKGVVGEKVESDVDLKLVAMMVAEECGGLPLLIQAVGNALKNKNIDIWSSALSRLKKHAPIEINPDIRKAFTRLKLSYDYLEIEEAKSCFLLCTLFGEDHNISFEDMAIYGVGLEKFDDLESMEDARDRVRNAVNILTSCGLLLKSELGEGFTKMHDVVRDVALLIASQSNNKFLVKDRQGLTEWLPRNNSLESYVGISLVNNNINKLPDYEVHLPNLQVFAICFNHDLSMISDEFIRCIKKVRILDISWTKISSLPHSFQLLTELHVLDLRGIKSLHEILVLGALRNLEILILNETGITEIPKEIAQLVNLRVLQVIGCKDLFRITQGVISRLWRLEELCIEFMLKFVGASDCIVEIMSLSKLTSLDFTVSSIDDIPAEGEGFNSEKLKKFMIQIGEYDRHTLNIYNTMWSGRYLVLSRVHIRIPLAKWLTKLIEGSLPITILNGTESINNIMLTLYDEGFNKLEQIKLNNCSNVSFLVGDVTRWDGGEGKTGEKVFKELKHLKLCSLNKLKVLWNCPDKYISLTNLVTLSIGACHELERVFTVSVAQGLVNLKRLNINGCDLLEEVIWVGEGGDDESGIITIFPSLAEIYLTGLTRLRSFYSGSENCRIKYPSLAGIAFFGCLNFEIWGPGIHETPNLKNIPDGPNGINDFVANWYETYTRAKQQAELHN